jgi:hypothetical protein
VYVSLSRLAFWIVDFSSEEVTNTDANINLFVRATRGGP